MCVINEHELDFCNLEEDDEEKKKLLLNTSSFAIKKAGLTLPTN